MQERLTNLKALIRFKDPVRIMYLLLAFPLFFVLHGNNENFGIIPIAVSVDLLLKYILITLGVIIFTLVWFRTPRKAFQFAFYLLVVFYFFGAFYDTLKEWFPNTRIYSYSILLPFVLIVTALVYWLVNRTRSLYAKFNRYLSAILIFFVAIEVLTMAFYLFNNKVKSNDLSGAEVSLKSIPSCDTLEKPDIFFIVFDGYTSSGILSADFDFSNHVLDSTFAANHYFVSSKSRSNYNFTAFSLGSTFRLSYLKSGVENGPVFPKEVLQAVSTMYDNQLMDFLAANGYGFRNYGRFEMDHLPSKEVSFFDYFYYELIDNQTFYARLKRDLGWKLAAKNVFSGKFQVPKRYLENKKAHLERNANNYDRLLHELTKDSTAPRFVYTHLMLPHEPFYLNADGSMTSDSAIIFNTGDERKGYVGQVAYSNKLIENIIEATGRPTGRPRVVIIEGDHGYRFWDKDNLHKEFPNLNAYYFTDHDYRQLYDSISPVNSFRVVLNKYFCQSFPLLKDSSIYLKKPGQ